MAFHVLNKKYVPENCTINRMFLGIVISCCTNDLIQYYDKYHDLQKISNFSLDKINSFRCFVVLAGICVWRKCTQLKKLSVISAHTLATLVNVSKCTFFVFDYF